MKGKCSVNELCNRTEWTQRHSEREFTALTNRVFTQISQVSAQAVGMVALLLGHGGRWSGDWYKPELWLYRFLPVNVSFPLSQTGRMDSVYFPGSQEGLNEMVIYFLKHVLRTCYLPGFLLNPDVCESCEELPKFKILHIILHFKNCPTLLSFLPHQRNNNKRPHSSILQ